MTFIFVRKVKVCSSAPAIRWSCRREIRRSIYRCRNFLQKRSNAIFPGFRMFPSANDGRVVIGWDPVIEGLFWVAGLGGHGVTTSSAVGALAADVLLGGQGQESAAFSPKRFSI